MICIKRARVPTVSHQSAPVAVDAPASPSGASNPRSRNSLTIASLCSLAALATASFRLASNWLCASCLFASSTDTSSAVVGVWAGAATDAVAFDGFASTPSLNPALSENCSGDGGVSPCSMKHRSSARLRAISTSYAAPIVAATRSLCSSRSRVSARSILSNLSVSSFAICFRRLITSATLLRSYPARVVLSTLRSPEAFLASRIFCFCPIDATRSFDATDEEKVSAEGGFSGAPLVGGGGGAAEGSGGAWRRPPGRTYYRRMNRDAL
mmetsp:Transcript_1793/g.6776  ORF Transcript_1793/g.6776 Transcript_1793/m.6776 type:complete len:268 (+) Transcript_1793:820-1623(+)